MSTIKKCSRLFKVTCRGHRKAPTYNNLAIEEFAIEFRNHITSRSGSEGNKFTGKIIQEG